MSGLGAALLGAALGLVLGTASLVLALMHALALSIRTKQQQGRRALTDYTIIAGNRLLPLAWLASAAALIVFVFPKT